MMNYRILEHCKRQNISYAELARRSGVGVLTVMKLGRNEETLNPRISTLQLIAKALKLPITALFVED